MAIFLVYLVMPVAGFLFGIGFVQFLVGHNTGATFAEVAKVVCASLGAFAVSGMLTYLFFNFAEGAPQPIGWLLVAGFALALALVGAGVSVLVFGLVRVVFG